MNGAGPLVVTYPLTGRSRAIVEEELGGTDARPEGHRAAPPVKPGTKYRALAADLRNAKGGQSSGPLETDRPWDAYKQGKDEVSAAPTAE